jgi:hypothetical protein
VIGAAWLSDTPRRIAASERERINIQWALQIRKFKEEDETKGWMNGKIQSRDKDHR